MKGKVASRQLKQHEPGKGRLCCGNKVADAHQTKQADFGCNIAMESRSIGEGGINWYHDHWQGDLKIREVLNGQFSPERAR
jgi:hypothetical protein